MTTVLEIYRSNRGFLEEKTVQQVVGMCGEGRLRVGSRASEQFRDLLAQLPSGVLRRYVDYCLTESFADGGLALQDLVNEVGSRLGFAVEFGRYRGGGDAIGFDGIWKSETGYSVVVEVKTSDVYRINLDTIADYRTRLAEQGKLDLGRSSAVVVVGRQETGDLEAQIRGSRHAWDIRLISIDALLQLLAVKESLAGGASIARISELLRPFEYTRIDRLVDLMFLTSAGATAEEVEPEEAEPDDRVADATGRTVPASFHEECIERIARSLGVGLVRDGRNRYRTSDKRTAVVCAVSKKYSTRGGASFWYAFHPTQKEYLEPHERSFVALGLGAADRVLLIPLDVFVPLLADLWTTQNDERMYWHVKLSDNGTDVRLLGKPPRSNTDLSMFLIREVSV